MIADYGHNSRRVDQLTQFHAGDRSIRKLGDQDRTFSDAIRAREIRARGRIISMRRGQSRGFRGANASRARITRLAMQTKPFAALIICTIARIMTMFPSITCGSIRITQKIGPFGANRKWRHDVRFAFATMISRLPASPR
jgi:hypothetical protein